MDSNNKRALVTPWQGPSEPSEFNIIRQLSAEGLSADSWSNNAGDVYAAHSHTYNKIIYCVSGSLTFGLPDTGDSVTLYQGDRIFLPAGVRHNAIIGSEGVYCLEAHS